MIFFISPQYSQRYSLMVYTYFHKVVNWKELFKYQFISGSKRKHPIHLLHTLEHFYSSNQQKISELDNQMNTITRIQQPVLLGCAALQHVRTSGWHMHNVSYVYGTGWSRLSSICEPLLRSYEYGQNWAIPLQIGSSSNQGIKWEDQRNVNDGQTLWGENLHTSIRCYYVQEQGQTAAFRYIITTSSTVQMFVVVRNYIICAAL